MRPKLKKTILDFIFPPIRHLKRGLLPDERFRLDADPTLYDHRKNGSAQQGVPVVEIFCNSTFWPGSGVVYSDNQLATASLVSQDREAVLKNLNSLRRYPTFRCRGMATSIEGVYPITNYYHLLIDTLPRVWGLRHPSLRSEQITLYLTRPVKSPLDRVLYALLPEQVTVKTISRFTRVRCDEYVLLPHLSKDRVAFNPDQDYTSAGFIPSEYLTTFQQVVFEILNIKEGPSKRQIYITRQNTSRRRLLNESEVRSFLERKGFEIVDPGGLSFAEQVKLFNEARIIVAQHGAALTNLLFMTRGSVIEIFSSDEQPQYYQQYAQTAGLDYEPISLNGRDNNSDATMPIGQLAYVLERICDDEP